MMVSQLLSHVQKTSLCEESTSAPVPTVQESGSSLSKEGCSDHSASAPDNIPMEIVLCLNEHAPYKRGGALGEDGAHKIILTCKKNGRPNSSIEKEAQNMHNRHIFNTKR